MYSELDKCVHEIYKSNQTNINLSSNNGEYKKDKSFDKDNSLFKALLDFEMTKLRTKNV